MASHQRSQNADKKPVGPAYPQTPDGRYFVVRGRLWRLADPALPAARKEALVHELMQARRGLRGNLSAAERAALRRQADEAKRALGERGSVWWRDGAPDYNRRLAKNTPYAGWFAGLADAP
jgi:hypothetical protein